MDPVLLPIWPETARALGLGRTKTHELVASGQLRSVLIGRRRLVPVVAIDDFVRGLASDRNEPQPAA